MLISRIWNVLANTLFSSVFCLSTAHQTPSIIPRSDLISLKLVNRIEELRSKWRIPGLTISIVTSPNHTGKDWINQTVPLGIANASGDNVTEDTMFGIASNSKLFTTLAIGMLIENDTALPNSGRLDWSTKVKDILPEWQLADEYASDHIDLIDLMSMRTGMPRHDLYHGSETPPELVSSMRYLRPSSELRQSFQYNNQHYFILGHIVASLSGIPFTQYVTDHIISPLNMTHTTYNGTEALLTGHRSDGFVRSGTNGTDCALNWGSNGTKNPDESCLGRPVSIGWWTEGSGILEAGAGGVIMSGRDMAIWLRELLSPTIIPPSLLTKATTTLLTMSGQTPFPELGIESYGLAQWVYTYRGHTIHGHSGDLPGQESIHTRLPDDGIGLMIAVNDAYLGRLILSTVQYMILDEMLGLEEIDWEERVFGAALKQVPTLLGRKGKVKKQEPSSDMVVGKYKAEGYGEIEISLLGSSLHQTSKPDSVLSNPSATLETKGEHKHQDLILHHFAPTTTTTNKGNKTNTLPLYITPLNKLFANNLLFTPYDGNIFNWTAITIWQTHGSSRDEWAMTIGGVGSCVITEKGIGMFGNYWGAGDLVGGKEPVLNIDRVEEEAEVWYARV